MAKTYITVCKNTILSNLKNGTNKPPIRVSKGKHGKPFYSHDYEATGSHVRIRYAGPNGKPLPWGARVWIEID